MAYISQITPLGSSTTYDLKAAMLTHTPNNTITFLRGDNTWSNTLTGNLLLSKDTNTEWANAPQLQLTGADSKIAAIKLTNSGTNLDIGWDWTARTGAGLGLRSTSSTDTAGGFYLFARNATENHELIGTAGGDLTWSGLLKITNNSNTTTIGSQDANWCHIYNSANIPFIFNNTVATTSGNLGTTAYPWNNLYIGTANGAGIYYKGTKNTYKMISFIDNTSDAYGNGIAIGGGGQTIIGGGESASALVAQAGTSGAEIMWIGNDSDIDFYPTQQNGFDGSARIRMSASTLFAGVSGNTTREANVGVASGAGDIYMFSQAATSGARGIYLPAHGTGAAKYVVWVDTNNNIQFQGSLSGNATTASKLTDLTSTDAASSSSTGRYVWFSYNDNTTGRPAYDTNFTYRSDIKTLTVPRINLNRNGATTYGRLQWYNSTYKTWTDYMSNAASGSCPSGGTPSTLGNVTTWAIRSYIENSSGYGWLWESAAETNTGTPTARMALSAYDGTLEVAGLVKITKNSNTVTIGAQNTGFCHFMNSANIPYYFDHEIQANGGFFIYNGNGQLGRVGKGVSWYQGRSNALVRITTSPTSNGWNPITSCKTTSGDWSTGILGETYYFVYTTDTNFNAGTNTTSNGVRITNTSQLYGAVWNDYAEYRKDNPNETQKSGYCVRELGDGTLALTTKRLERGCEIISDTFGFAVGQDEENGYNTPIASNGRVLAYPYESIEEFASHIGWPVCSGPNGTVSIMTEEEEEKYPSRIIGTISEIPTYEEWGTGNVKVNGRVWIRIR